MARPTEAFISANMSDLGQGYVLFARFRGGEAELGVFLVDVYCLGVKDAFYTRVREDDYAQKILNRMLPPENRKPLAPPSARRLVEDAVAYAQNLGFAPHPDYKLAGRVFGDTDAAAATEKFACGQQGKPYYIQGQSDSPEKCRHILRQLHTRCGEGNFNFLIVGGDNVIEEWEREGFPGGPIPPMPPADLN